MKLYDILWNYEAVRLGQKARRLLQDGVELVTVWGLATLNGPTASSAGSDACGDSSDGGTVLRDGATSHGSMKQEEVRE